MTGAIPACFRGSATGGPPTSTAAGPSLTTSVYESRLGLVALTWSRTVLGLSLRTDLRLSSGVDEGEDDDDDSLRFHVRPWLFWKRRGSKRFHLKEHRRHRVVELVWDLTMANFSPCGGPEPTSGYYVAVSVDGDSLVVAGDLADEAYKRTKVQRPKAPFSKPVLISRREHVVLGDAGDRRSYRTRARFGGREREISIDLGAKEKDREVGMSVSVDGERVLQVRRLRWKFRGSEKVEVEGGGRIQISWDLHNWLFQSKDDASDSVTAAAPTAELGHAVFVFRFEREEGKDSEGRPGMEIPGNTEGYFGKGLLFREIIGGVYFGKKRRDWSKSSSDGGGGEVRRRGRRKHSLRKTSSSSSSTSSASSASSSTVMEWASQEEVELQRAEGFSLVVYAWKC